MGSGIDAAATMGRLRTATTAFAHLDLDPAQVLQHLDAITSELEHYIATCVYAAYDPHRAECRIANAGHLPPVLIRSGKHPRLLDLPTGTPLGVGGIPFETTTFGFGPGDQLVLYTDGLVETRHHPIDERLDTLLRLLDAPDSPLEETCDRLLHDLRSPDDHGRRRPADRPHPALHLRLVAPSASSPAPWDAPSRDTVRTLLRGRAPLVPPGSRVKPFPRSRMAQLSAGRPLRPGEHGKAAAQAPFPGWFCERENVFRRGTGRETARLTERRPRNTLVT